jgi:hypothetical protein
MDIKYHWQWQEIEWEIVRFKFISSEDNTAIGVTKLFAIQPVNTFGNLIRMDESDRINKWKSGFDKLRPQVK